MPKNKRMRLFAGPNGSGKSSLFREFQKKYKTGFFVNADEFEKKLASSGFIDLNEIGIEADESALAIFKKTKEAESLLAKAKSKGVVIDFKIINNLIVDKEKDAHSYEASYAAAFVRYLLIKNNKSFSFESVMSHPSKLKEIKEANKKGYKTYLYFVCTEDPLINISRIENRVYKGGHPVAKAKIRSRYNDSLKNLAEAITLSYRAYLFDNSSQKQELIAEVFEGDKFKLLKDELPEWFISNVLDKLEINNK